MRLVAILAITCLTFERAIVAHPYSKVSSPPGVMEIVPTSQGDVYLPTISQAVQPSGSENEWQTECYSPYSDPQQLPNSVYLDTGDAPSETEGMLCKKGFVGLALKGAKMMIKAGATDAVIKGVGKVAASLARRDIDSGIETQQQKDLPSESKTVAKRGFSGLAAFKSFKSFGKVFKGFGGKASGALGAAGNVAMVASVATPLLASAPKAAAAEGAAVAKAATATPAAAEKAKEKAKPKTESNGDKEKKAEKREVVVSSTNRLEHKETQEESEVLPQRRGPVSRTAGQVVTGLMVLGLGKQLFSAVVPKLHSQQATQQTQMYQQMAYTPQMYSPQMYASGPSQYPPSGFNRRGVAAEEEEKKAVDNNVLDKRSVMDAASHFVTVGFAVQAIQDNFKPIVREMGRLEHKGLHEARKYMGGKQAPPPAPHPPFPGPRGYYQRRDITDAEEDSDSNSATTLNRRGVMDKMMRHPATGKVMNGANYLVTLSMLTGLASQYVDAGIAKAKEKTQGGPNQRQPSGRMRRSLDPIDETSPPLLKRFQGRLQGQLTNNAPAMANEGRDSEEIRLDKRVDLGGVGKWISKAANSKTGQAAIKMAGLLI